MEPEYLKCTVASFTTLDVAPVVKSTAQRPPVSMPPLLKSGWPKLLIRVTPEARDVVTIQAKVRMREVFFMFRRGERRAAWWDLGKRRGGKLCGEKIA